jgi:hypothetical protein
MAAGLWMFPLPGMHLNRRRVNLGRWQTHPA